MTTLDLQQFHNKTVVITFRDGEIASARLTCTSEHCDDVLVDILSTNCPDRYHEPNACSYTVPATEIVSVVEATHADFDASADSESPAELRAA